MSATTSALPTIGSQLAGGTYAGITTGKDGVPYALILLDDKPAERLTWRKAINWAKKLDAELPTRPEGALLFAEPILELNIRPTRGRATAILRKGENHAVNWVRIRKV